MEGELQWVPVVQDGPNWGTPRVVGEAGPVLEDKAAFVRLDLGPARHRVWADPLEGDEGEKLDRAEDPTSAERRGRALELDPSTGFPLSDLVEPTWTLEMVFGRPEEVSEPVLWANQMERIRCPA